jgi:hypothetical protein
VGAGNREQSKDQDRAATIVRARARSRSRLLEFAHPTSLLAGTWPLLAGAPDDLCLPCARKGDTIALSDAPPALDERRS